ncbi:MAG: response regulator transcription factor, partial [Candidatus Aminicenantes bacterium]|nr:response regulator transcription factor [Candidatus Aminicenantes bacterium]
RKGLSQRQIAKKLGISRNTVKKYIENQGYPEEQKHQQRKSLLDPFNGNIAFWLNEDLEYTAICLCSSTIAPGILDGFQKGP